MFHEQNETGEKVNGNKLRARTKAGRYIDKLAYHDTNIHIVSQLNVLSIVIHHRFQLSSRNVQEASAFFTPRY